MAVNSVSSDGQYYLDLLYQEPYMIGHWVGFKDLTELNNEWIRQFIYEEKDQTLLAHRGSYKTTSLSIAIAIMLIIQPDENIIFMRKTDTDVVEIITQVANILDSPVMRRIIKTLHGVDLVFTKRSGSEINTNMNTHSRGTASLVGLGINASVTGKHASKVITDDIVNSRDRVSKAERLTTRRAYMELQNIKNIGGRFINTGTPWHKEDAIKLMPNVKKYDVYDTGFIKIEELRDLQSKMTPSLFSANYELKHIADEEAMFTNPHYSSVVEGIYNGIAHVDSAYGGGDGTAFTIARKVGDKYIVFGKLWHKHVDDCLEEMLRYHKFYRAGTIYSETNADKGYLAKELKGRGYQVKTYHEKANKYMKIATHLRGDWDNIYFLEGTDAEYISQVLDYTENAEHDDAPDSLASIVRVLENSTKRGSNKDVVKQARRFGL